MKDDLYFIPIIAEALRQRDPKESLRQAFNRITLLGKWPQYVVGLKQFEQFMAIVEAEKSTGHTRLVEANIISMLITELVTDTFEGSDDEKQKVVSLIRSQPLWHREYDELIAETEWLSRGTAGIGITIFRENREFDSVVYKKIPDSKTIEEISPGRYCVTFDTGRLIWEGEFVEQDLLWTRAFPGRPLELAADTSGWKGNPTKYFSALNGEIIIRVFAGLESGRIEITLNASEDVK